MSRARGPVALAVSLSLFWAWGWPGRAQAGEAAPSKAAVSKTCTEGCHEELGPHQVEKHKDVTCLDCHPNVPDGKAEHESALDDTPTEKMCATAGCHPDEASKVLAGSHKDASCETCHGNSHEEFKRTDVKACRQCHKDEVVAWNESIHARAKKPAQCADCHGDMHDVKLHDDPLAPMSKVLQVTTCGECHDDKYVRAYRDSVHGVGVLKSGLAVAPSCNDCHGSHEIVPVKEDASRISRKNVTQTCGECHKFIVARWKNSTHGELAAKGDKKGPVCTNCHPGHLTFDPTVYGNHLKMADKCGECHEAQSRSYRDSFHGKATRMGYQVSATCADCHTPHEMLPAKNPKSSVSKEHLKATCERCHEGANDEFIAFAPHLDPTARDGANGNLTVHYIWLFMTTLLLSVLGFFGLHTLLWLQRSIVGFRRKEFAHHAEGEVWFRRFVPTHIWIHVTIVLTFLMLAATGLPLKFSNEGWAQSLGVFFGGLAGSRWLHRLAGVVTFAYGLFFVAYLVREVGFRKRRGLLWGWQSLVPNLQDLKLVLANLKWFLYLGPRPKLDRWTYWEKFDFLAVFWGIPVIGLSGVVLWAPLWATQYVPGWMLNVAYLVHSDEALLATGFIFFFHFFHTHLRPEAFPMDTVIFLGSMPLERFKDERPLEYERLLKSGELEKHKVPKPGERAVRRAYRFGAITLTIGVILGVLLFVAAFKGLTH